MGTRQKVKKQPRQKNNKNMKLVGALILSLFALASAEDCISPTFKNRQAVYKQPAAIDLDKLKAEIAQKNAVIKKANPETKILDLDELKEKFGDKVRDKLEKLKKKKQVKVAKKA